MSKTLEAKISLYTRIEGYREPILNLSFTVNMRRFKSVLKSFPNGLYGFKPEEERHVHVSA